MSQARPGGGKVKKRRRTPESEIDEASLDGEANGEAALNISGELACFTLHAVSYQYMLPFNFCHFRNACR